MLRGGRSNTTVVAPLGSKREYDNLISSSSKSPKKKQLKTVPTEDELRENRSGKILQRLDE